MIRKYGLPLAAVAMLFFAVYHVVLGQQKPPQLEPRQREEAGQRRPSATPVTAVVVDVDAAATERLRESWRAWGFEIPLVHRGPALTEAVRKLNSH